MGVRAVSPTGGELVVDVQTHHVNPNRSWREGGGFEGALRGFIQANCGEPDFVDCFDADHYIRELFVNSDTAGALEPARVSALSEDPRRPSRLELGHGT